MLLFKRIQVQFPAPTRSSSQLLVTSAAGPVIWSTWADFHTKNLQERNQVLVRAWSVGPLCHYYKWCTIWEAAELVCFCFGFCGRGFLVMQTDLEFSDLYIRIMTAWPENRWMIEQSHPRVLPRVNRNALWVLQCPWTSELCEWRPRVHRPTITKA